MSGLEPRDKAAWLSLPVIHIPAQKSPPNLSLSLRASLPVCQSPELLSAHFLLTFSPDWRVPPPQGQGPESSCSLCIACT